MDNREVHAVEIVPPQQTPVRGDSFDVGSGSTGQALQKQDILTEILNNPENLDTLLNLTPKQLQNLRSILIAAGTGGAHKYLSELIGDEPAAIIGAGLSAWLAKRYLR